MTLDFYALKGTVENGMFPNEIVFTATDPHGNPVVLSVPRELVQEVDGAPTLRVRLLGRDNGTSVVRVLGESSDSGVVSVRSSDLKPA